MYFVQKNSKNSMKAIFFKFWRFFLAFEYVLVPGVLPYWEIGGGGGGLDLTSSLEAKFGARSDQVHQIRGKTWEVLLPQDAKVGKKSQFWGHTWNSEGKIWVFVTYIFGGKIWDSTRISEGKFGAKLPQLLIWKYPLGFW